jgi:hypothetical protein
MLAISDVAGSYNIAVEGRANCDRLPCLDPLAAYKKA